MATEPYFREQNTQTFFRILSNHSEGKGMRQIYHDRREAARILTERGLKTSWKTLQKLATVGGGPEYRIFGSRAVYTDEALDDYVERKLSAPRRSTSEAA